jgi:hypothetical protein
MINMQLVSREVYTDVTRKFGVFDHIGEGYRTAYALWDDAHGRRVSAAFYQRYDFLEGRALHSKVEPTYQVRVGLLPLELRESPTYIGEM